MHGRANVSGEVPVFSSRSCPCGVEHQLTREHRRTLARIVKAKGELVTVAGYAVPRVYISIHGMPAGDVAELAKKYGWGKVMTRE